MSTTPAEMRRPPGHTPSSPTIPARSVIRPRPVRRQDSVPLPPPQPLPTRLFPPLRSCTPRPVRAAARATRPSRSRTLPTVAAGAGTATTASWGRSSGRKRTPTTAGLACDAATRSRLRTARCRSLCRLRARNPQTMTTARRRTTTRPWKVLQDESIWESSAAQ